VTVGLVFLIVVVAGLITYYLLVPANTFIMFRRRGGGHVSFSRKGIELDGPPDRHTADAFDHIEHYVCRLMAPLQKKQFLGIFTPDGERGFGLYSCNGKVEAQLSVEWQREPEREAAIRAFFEALGSPPTIDYLAGSGGVPDAKRMLAFPLVGSPSEVAAVTRRILQELCGVSSTEPVDFHYAER
jgi:hypothetical protein